MGADQFSVVSKGKNAEEAFSAAVRRAQYDHGHAGYTGTIAEKDAFVMIDLPEGPDAKSYAEKLIDDLDGRVVDKWGPAGCIDLGNGKYLFFGWASS
jgi:hypothetical protein